MNINHEVRLLNRRLDDALRRLNALEKSQSVAAPKTVSTPPSVPRVDSVLVKEQS